MTKLVKLSLVAAVAVSGLTSTVAAKPLEEAIKGVDVSGTVVYRYDDRNDDEADASSSSNSYKAAVNIKAPVNDMIDFNARITTGLGATVDNSVPLIGLDTQAGTDANPSLHLSEANFTLKAGMLTAIVGKQGIATPWTVAQDADGDENNGTGIVALADLGVATVAAAYFNQTNIDVPVLATVNVADGARDLAALAVIAPLGPVNFSAWYADMEEAFDSYTIAVDANIMDMATVAARYTSLDPDNDYSAADTQKAWDISVSGDLGPVGLSARYGNTDEDGGLVSLNTADAATDIGAWNITATNAGYVDADFWHLSANMDLMPGLNAAINYATVDAEIGAADHDEDEVYGQLTYTMGDNFSTYFRYGTYDVETEGLGDVTDQTRGRLQVQYSF